MSERIFPAWDGRFIIHDGELARRVFDIPWFWAMVWQAAKLQEEEQDCYADWPEWSDH